MKLVKIIVKNFQSHALTKVDISQGLTVITGESDSGKTSLFKRALEWCWFNQPEGEDFVRFDPSKINDDGSLGREDECYVTTIFDNGIEVTRKRFKKKNIYEITDENGEVFQFESFGNKVPLKVQELLGIYTLQIDKENTINLNIPAPKDASLIYQKNIIKAKALGAFVGTHIIDAAIRDIQSTHKTISLETNTTRKDIESIEKDLISLGDLKKEEDLISLGNELINSITETNNSLLKLQDKEKSIKESNNLVESCNLIIKDKPLLNNREIEILNLQNKISDIKDKVDIFNKIFKLYNSVLEKKDNIERCTNILNTRNNLDELELVLKRHEVNIESISLKNDKATDFIFKLNTLINSINIKENQIKECNKLIDLKESTSKLEKKTINLENKVKSIEDNDKATREIGKKLFTIKRNIVQANKTISMANNYISEHQALLKEDVNKLNLIESKLEKISTTFPTSIDFISKLEGINTSIADKRKKENAAIEWLPIKEKELNSIVDSCVENIQKLGKCPVCLSNIDTNHLKDIRSELLG